MHRPGRRPSFGLVERERMIDQHRELGRSVRKDGEQRGSRSRRSLHELLVHRAGFVNEPPGQELEQRRTDAPQIGLRVDVVRAAEGLLRGHEGRRADHGSGSRSPRFLHFRSVRQTGDSEVEDLHFADLG